MGVHKTVVTSLTNMVITENSNLFHTTCVVYCILNGVAGGQNFSYEVDSRNKAYKINNVGWAKFVSFVQL